MANPGAAGGFALDLGRVRRSFDRASSSYDGAAVLHAEVRVELLRRLELTALTPRVILDAGAGTGHATRALKRRYPSARVIALDSAPGMLRESARQSSWLRRFDRICGDAHCLPLADASVDLVFSSLMLPWCDPDLVFAEFRRVLTPRGALCCSAFGPDTLRELRGSWAQACGLDHVHPGVDMHDYGDALVRAGFAAPVLDVDRFTLTYEDLDRLTADLKAVGANNSLAVRARGLTGKRRYAAMRRAYEAFRVDGRLPATYEVVYAQAWVPAAGTERSPRKDPTFPLASLRAQLRGGKPS